MSNGSRVNGGHAADDGAVVDPSAGLSAGHRVAVVGTDGGHTRGGYANGNQSTLAAYSYTTPWHVIGPVERATVLFRRSQAPVNLEVTPTGNYWSWKATAAGWTCAGAAKTPSEAKASALDAASERYSEPTSGSER